tara:strand:- start:3109 stop:3630 length:522 start_codon:yes stop_codon:yes gene_type:complete
MKKVYLLLALLIVLLVFLSGCGKEDKESKGKIVINTPLSGSERTFIDTGEDICTQGGKPIIREFGTTWCPHCQWIKETFASVVSEYEDDGVIIAYQWDVDIGDNALTEEVETAVLDSEMQIFAAYNKEGSVPTFVFGCKYLRVGNGYELQGNLAAEEIEFREIIEELISAQNN